LDKDGSAWNTTLPRRGEPPAGFGADGEVGQEAQETYGTKNPEASSLEAEV
jgi:hypothetical protein